MAEIWQTIVSINSFEELWEWYKMQSLGMKAFLGLIAFGCFYSVLKLFIALVPWEE